MKLDILGKDVIENLLKEGKSVRYILLSANMNASGSGSYRNFINYCKKKNIDLTFYSFEYKGNGTIDKKNLILENILIENSTYSSSSSLKTKLLKNNLLDYRCYGDNCNIKDEWLSKKITLQLDHINGINNDNRISNLRLLCPNCHSQTKTYCKNKNFKS